jgi:hypothetical protein
MLSTLTKLSHTDRLVRYALTLASAPLTFAELVSATGITPLSLAKKLPKMTKAGHIITLRNTDPTRYGLPSTDATPLA